MTGGGGLCILLIGGSTMTTQTARVETLNPLPRRSNLGMAQHRMELSNYYAGRALRMRQFVARFAALGDTESEANARADERWYRAHAAELRADAGEYLRADARGRMIDAHERTQAARMMEAMQAEHRAGLIAESEAGA